MKTSIASLCTSASRHGWLTATGLVAGVLAGQMMPAWAGDAPEASTQ